MKIIISNLLLVFLICCCFACSDDGKVRDLGVTAVQTLYQPDNGKLITLRSSSSAILSFEWSPAQAEDNGVVLYEIAFDKPDGDFSNPIFLTSSDNNGGSNSATLTHKQLNKIAALAGTEAGQPGTLKWTIFSSKGINPVKAKEERTLTVTRLEGLADIPDNLYITGEGSEAGDDLSAAMILKKIEDGEFEIYTKLTAGSAFKFVSAQTGTPLEFSLSPDKIVPGGSSTVETTGVYLIKLDFNTATYSTTLVTRIGFFFSPSNSILFNLPYIGNGIFQAKDQTVTFHQESWGRDERYKFRMFVKENGGAATERELEWCTLNSTDSPPTSSSPASYYYIRLTEDLTQWDNKWKLMGIFDGVPADYTMYLQADAPYTHDMVVK